MQHYLFIGKGFYLFQAGYYKLPTGLMDYSYESIKIKKIW
uniref:Uncharacterized protein n=1 Tax=uncultured Desulfobacterium sp. TaxID=201089 RepID=E1YD66_9BACT|nr:unknown protein [uncultured Desulfobacterium sp.]